MIFFQCLEHSCCCNASPTLSHWVSPGDFQAVHLLANSMWSPLTWISLQHLRHSDLDKCSADVIKPTPSMLSTKKSRMTSAVSEFMTLLVCAGLLWVLRHMATCAVYLKIYSRYKKSTVTPGGAVQPEAAVEGMGIRPCGGWAQQEGRPGALRVFSLYGPP